MKSWDLSIHGITWQRHSIITSLKDWWSPIAKHGEIGVPGSANLVDIFVQQIGKALEALNAHEVTLVYKCKRRVEDADDHSLERAMLAIDCDIGRGDTRIPRKRQRRRTQLLEAQLKPRPNHMHHAFEQVQDEYAS